MYAPVSVKRNKRNKKNYLQPEIPVTDGYPREGVFSADYEWGYFSGKDGEKHSFDLCEECYDRLLASFKLPADIENK